MENKWLKWADRLQAISQAGLAHSKDDYNLERFEQLRELGLEMLNGSVFAESEKITTLFADATGRITPKVAVRAVIFNEGKLLLVRERTDGNWALPGGWADIGLSPAEVAVKEIKEESGFDADPVRLLGLLDKRLHYPLPAPYPEYVLFILCEIVGGEAGGGLETSEARFFTENGLPALSESRTTRTQLQTLFAWLREPDKEAVFD